MSIHTLGGVNYRSKHRIHVDPEVTPRGWYCRWEIPTQNGSPTEVQMHGEWVGPARSEAASVALAQEDFAGCAAEPPEPINSEYVNDR